VAWVLDLDGVVWLGDQPVPGAAEAVARLREAGERVLFATNNSSVVVAEQEAKLAGHGIPARGDVVTSAMAAAGLVRAGERVLVSAGPGVFEALEARGIEGVDAGALAKLGERAPETGRGSPRFDVVMVGFHRDFDYGRMRVAAEAIRAGARFVATNADTTYPTPNGLIPGGGAIAAAIAAASDVEPSVAGKPYAPMAELIHAIVREEPGDGLGMMVGDRPETDGAFAAELGYRFGLVLTGVTGPDDLPVEPSPDLLATDLAALVATVLGP
jgi:HAD superfamily hydrolase (TIGR01450 family)